MKLLISIGKSRFIMKKIMNLFNEDAYLISNYIVI